MPYELISWLEQSKLGLPASLPTRSAKIIDELHFAMESASVNLIIEIEAWEIAFPAAELFRMALTTGVDAAQTAFKELATLAIEVLPTEIKEGSRDYFSKPMPTADQVAKLGTLVTNYQYAVDNVSSYVHDLTVEVQNVLLASLFERKVKLRQPIDPALKVVTDSNREELIKYFGEDTALGRRNKEAEDAVRKSLAGSGRSTTKI
jgi:hypothetical protein